MSFQNIRRAVMTIGALFFLFGAGGIALNFYLMKIILRTDAGIGFAIMGFTFFFMGLVARSQHRHHPQ